MVEEWIRVIADDVRSMVSCALTFSKCGKTDFSNKIFWKSQTLFTMPLTSSPITPNHLLTVSDFPFPKCLFSCCSQDWNFWIKQHTRNWFLKKQKQRQKQKPKNHREPFSLQTIHTSLLSFLHANNQVKVTRCDRQTWPSLLSVRPWGLVVRAWGDLSGITNIHPESRESIRHHGS